MTLTQTADRAALIEELARADFPLDVGYAEIAYTQEVASAYTQELMLRIGIAVWQGARKHAGGNQS